MKKALPAILATVAALFARPASAETVQIANAADWAAFADRVNSGETTLDAEMTANVMLVQNSPRVGTDGNPYGGAFDGQGHRLTLNWNLPGVDFAAPFAYVAGAAISNLHTMGSITTDRHFTSGLVGDVKLPGTTISSCRSSVAITSSYSGDITGGGFMSRTIQVVDTKIDNCLFDGSLLFANGHSIGGFVGYNEHDAAMKISNSMFAPSEVVLSSNYHCATFCRGYNNITVENSFYKQTIATAQGTDASSMSAQDLAAALGEKWTVSNGKAMLKVFEGPVVLSDGEIYTVASSETLEGENGLSPINVAAGARAVINIKSGATLTVIGGNASGTTGAAPAIRVPETSTLYIVGDGTLIATGGAAANGGAGGDGSSGKIDIPNKKGRGGAGGGGGGGGGGGAPAIGGIGGVGGVGGAGGDYTEWKTCGNNVYSSDGNRGRDGSSGATGGGMGQVVILGNLTVQATAGAAATSDGTGGSNGAVDTDAGSGWTYDFTGGGGGGGGGGARGQNAEYGIGGGGAGGAGGGGGGGGGTYQSDSHIAIWGLGGTGGSSYCGTAGASGSSGGGQWATSEVYGWACGGYGGNGGSANTTRGGNGTFQTMDCVTLTVSPTREAAQPVAQSAEDAPAAPVTVTFMSDGASVDTAQATLMLAPPSAPAPAAKANYAFQGYYTAGGTKIYDADRNPVYPVWQTIEDTTLYAHWVPAYSVTFVSTDATVGSVVYVEGETGAAAPIPTRAGDYTFLGYFTEDGSQVFDGNGALVEGALSGLPSNVSLYAHWAVPEGSVVKLVYRGQLNLLTGDPAVNDTTYTKRMHFRVYDGSEATTPLWQTGNEGVDVTVNADGSFVYSFGDDNLAALIATGRVTHVGLAIGPSASLAMEMKPRRELRPVAAVNRALTAEGAALDIRIGNLATENSLVAADATVSKLEVAGTVNAYGAGKVSVSPLTIGPAERTKLLRGKGVRVFSKEKPQSLPLSISGAVLRGQVIATAPSDGIALISSSDYGRRALRCPAVVQYCKKGDKVRAPTSDEGGLKVTFFPFVGSAR